MRGARVDVEPGEGLQANVPLIEFLDNLDQMLRVASEPVELPHDQHVPRPTGPNRPRPTRAVGRALQTPPPCRYQDIPPCGGRQVVSPCFDHPWTPVHSRYTPLVVPPCASTCCAAICCTLDCETGCCTPPWQVFLQQTTCASRCSKEGFVGRETIVVPGMPIPPLFPCDKPCRIGRCAESTKVVVCWIPEGEEGKVS